MEHPYYIIPIIERYKNMAPDTDEARKLALIISVNIGNRDVLHSILNPRHLSAIEEELSFGPGMCLKGEEDENQGSTLTGIPTGNESAGEGNPMDTIDSFLDKFGGNIPATGYLAQAEKEMPVKVKPPRSREEADAKPKKSAGNDEVSLLKSLIKDHRYSEAIALIESQNLNNPQKSIYFAHQMRFIKKLIAIENYKNQPKG